MATLLAICQAAADRMGLPRPPAVATSADQTTRTLLGCAQREGIALSRRWAWQALLTEHTFSATAATVQTSGIPAAWDGRMVSQTFWNRTQRRPVSGPLTSQEWQALQASGVQVATDSYRIRNSLIELVPTPTAGWTYAYEYISKNWCANAAGSGQSAWTLDTDVTILDAEIQTLGIVWRFLQGRGFDASDVIGDYETAVMNGIARDGSRRVVNLATGPAWMGRDAIGVSEGSWPL